MLNGAERPLLLAGRGVTSAGAQAELQALGEKAHMPVVTTLLGKSCIPETHPLCLGMGVCTARRMPIAHCRRGRHPGRRYALR